MKSKPKIICLIGPTASGKTELALKLCKKFQGFVISADSRQIYKGMNIGTAKPHGVNKNDVYYVENIPHYLMNIINPDQEFTLSDWQKKTKDIIHKHANKNSKYEIPIIVGGTGLYISSIVNNYQLPSGKINQKTRIKLQKENINELLKKLEKLDSDTFAVIDKKNKRRIVRALEYVLTNNKSFLKNTKSGNAPFAILQIGINLTREELHKRIDKRVNKMIAGGLINETEGLLKKYPATLPPLSGIGYQECYYYLNGYLSMDDLKNLIKKNTRHYAKRQLTWFKRDKNIKWVNNYQLAEKLVKEFLEN